MPLRDTSTGKEFEEEIRSALTARGYRAEQPIHAVSDRPGGGEYYPNRILECPDGRLFLLSLSWQQSAGTTEHKVPYEVISLAHAVRANGTRYSGAFLVLGGSGWTLKRFYTSGELGQYLKGCEAIRIMAAEEFLAAVDKRTI